MYFATGMSGHVVGQVRRGMCKIEDKGPVVALCNLDARCGESCLCWGCWRLFFWLVWLRCSEWGNLMTSIKGQDEGMLMLWFIVVCSGDRSSVDGKNGVGT
jgi:hypothetical protein